VVLVSPEIAPGAGGVATVARSLAEGLLALGVTVRVYTAKGLAPEMSGLPEGTVRQLYLPTLDLWGDLLVTIDALAGDAPDVIHLCHPGLGPWVPALAAVSPAVVSVEARGGDLVAPAVRRGGDPAGHHAAQRAGLGTADAVIAGSAFAAELLAAAGADPASIDVAAYGVDGERFSPGPVDEALAARLEIAAGDEVLLTVSRLAAGKGHATVLRALAELLHRRPRALYVYTGEDAHVAAELSALADELGVKGRVRAAGRVVEKDLPALYRLARISVQLSDEGPPFVGGSGMALLEAAACGLPVVATRTGALPFAIADRLTGLLVRPGAPHLVARAIECLLADPERARAMGARGRARVLANFSVRQRAQRLLDRWSNARRGDAGPRALAGLAAAFAGELAPTGDARTLATRCAARKVESGADLARIAREDAISRGAEDARRRERLARIVEAGQVVRLRARKGGAGGLVDALAECAALGHAPHVEVGLAGFLAPEFQAQALPRIRSVTLDHSVPAEGAVAIMAGLLALPEAAFAKVDGLRLSLTAEARASPWLVPRAFRETQALRRAFSRRSIEVAPPPELAPRVEADFAPRARSVDGYEETLCADRAPVAWIPATLEQALLDQARLLPGERPLVVDLGCGVGVALLGLVATAARAGIEVTAVGLDRGFDGLLHGDRFPDDEDGLRSIVARHGARIGDLDGVRLPSILRLDLEVDPWPLGEGTVALAVSRTAVMYLADKLRFLERVYTVLRPGGVALIHFDHLRPGTRELTRLRPGAAGIDEILEEQRARGVEIHGQGNFVIAMRRGAVPLSFPWRLSRAYPMAELTGGEEPWGAVAHYADCGGPPPDGRYKHVTVERRPVPLVLVRDGGAMVLVDTVGSSPRRWTEQFKRRGDLPNGTYDLHRTSPGGTLSFADAPVDRRGLWTIDRKGNITLVGPERVCVDSGGREGGARGRP
jgi:glycosyltransferase involved in cell wall biosynthesis/SAM-dependent methyltransferase